MVHIIGSKSKDYISCIRLGLLVLFIGLICDDSRGSNLALPMGSRSGLRRLPSVDYLKLHTGQSDSELLSEPAKSEPPKRNISSEAVVVPILLEMANSIVSEHDSEVDPDNMDDEALDRTIADLVRQEALIERRKKIETIKALRGKINLDKQSANAKKRSASHHKVGRPRDVDVTGAVSSQIEKSRTDVLTCLYNTLEDQCLQEQLLERISQREISAVSEVHSLSSKYQGQEENPPLFPEVEVPTFVLETPTPQHRGDVDRFRELSALFGSLKVNPGQETLSDEVEENFCQSYSESPNHNDHGMPVDLDLQYEYKFKEPVELNGIAVGENNEYIFTDRLNSCVLILDPLSEAPVIRTLGLGEFDKDGMPLLKAVCDVVAESDGSLVVLDPKDTPQKRFKYFTKDGNFDGSGGWTETQSCHGIAVDRKCRIQATDSIGKSVLLDEGDRPNKIFYYGNDLVPFECPWYLCVNPANDDIVVTDTGPGLVVVLDKHGQHRFTYGNDRNTCNTMFRAGRTCCDQKHIFIMDHGNQTIHVISQDGDFICNFPIAAFGEFLSPPTLLAVDPKGCLVVANHMGHIKTFLYAFLADRSEDIARNGKHSVYMENKLNM